MIELFAIDHKKWYLNYEMAVKHSILRWEIKWILLKYSSYGFIGSIFTRVMILSVCMVERGRSLDAMKRHCTRTLIGCASSLSFIVARRCGRLLQQWKGHLRRGPSALVHFHRGIPIKRVKKLTAIMTESKMTQMPHPSNDDAEQNNTHRQQMVDPLRVDLHLA